jgi:hypothetical protein
MLPMECLVLSAACTLASSCVPFHGKFPTKETRSSLTLSWRHLLIRTFDMACLPWTCGIVSFEFETGGIFFDKLWLLVDNNIYPELECFVKTLDEAVGHTSKKYAAWQEAA